MQEQIAPYHKPLLTWVLMADAENAQIYSCHKITHKMALAGANKHHYYNEKPDHELVSIENGRLKAESINDYQIGHDRRGTSSSSNSPTHNTYEPHGDITEELKNRFTRIIADKLKQAHDADLFDRLILVAPARIVTALKEVLSPYIVANISAIVPKDLMQYHGSALMAHLRETLVTAHID